MSALPAKLVRAVAKYERRIYVHADCPPTKKAECTEDISAAQAEVARLAVEFVKEAKRRDFLTESTATIKRIDARIQKRAAKRKERK